jgi:hypothetical protein
MRRPSPPLLVVQLLWPAPQTIAPPRRCDHLPWRGMAEDTGPLPDAVTRGRALTCAALHAAGVAPVVVFTGAGNDTLSAAEAMAQPWRGGRHAPRGA